MPSRNLILQLYYYSLFFLAFSIPFPFIFSSVAIGVLAFFWLLQLNIPSITTKAKERKFIWIWVLFFLQTAVSYFYSTNKDQSAFDIQIKLSFIILPIIIGLGPTLHRSGLEKVFSAFIAGLTVVALICLVKATLSYRNPNDFFYHSLVRGFDANAVYYSVYTLFALSILLIYQPGNSLLGNRIFKYCCLIILLVFFILLSSRLLLFLFITLLVPTYFLQTVRSKTFRLSHLLGMAGVLFLFAAIVLTNNPIKSRYLEIRNNNTIVKEVSANEQSNTAVFNNLSLRLFLWKIALDNIKKHNLWFAGCGNGDVERLQKDRLIEFNKNTNALSNHPPLWHYNLHNMYLQVLMMLGIPGLAIFLLIVFVPFSFAKRLSNGLVFILFNVIIALFFCQESALQTQAGIIHYAFFSQLFLLHYYSEQENGHIDVRAFHKDQHAYQ